METRRVIARVTGLASALGLGGCIGFPPAPPELGDTGSGLTTSTRGDETSSSTSSGGPAGSSSTTTGPAPDPSSTSLGDTTGAPPATCDDERSGCDANATCNDDTGRVVCTCNPGYDGDGTRCSVDAVLDPLRVDVLCSRDSCGGLACVAPPQVTAQGMLTGTPELDYAVTLRIRGVAEENEFVDGVADGPWYVGGSPTNPVWNTFSLTTSAPEQTFYLNHGDLAFGHCEALDYERTITVRGQSTVTVSKVDSNGCMTINVDPGGQPIVIPDIPPAPDAFDGQFIQVDVVSIVPEA